MHWLSKYKAELSFETDSEIVAFEARYEWSREYTVRDNSTAMHCKQRKKQRVTSSYARENPSGDRLVLTTCMLCETIPPSAEHEKDSAMSGARRA